MDRNLIGNSNPNWRGGKVSKVCEECGLPFKVIPSREIKAKFCSLKCANLYQSKNVYPGQVGRKPGFKVDTAPVDRFLASFTPRTEVECWEWNGRKNKCGYGIHCVDNKKILAHRYSYGHFFGKIPQGMNVLHRCDVPFCVNPSHLFLGSQAANVADMVNKGRGVSNPPRGENHPNMKLYDRDVLLMRTLRLSGSKLKSLSSMFGVSESLVSMITRGIKRQTTRM